MAVIQACLQLLLTLSRAQHCLVQDRVEELESQGTASATASAEVATANAQVATVTAERDAMHKKLAAAKRSITALRLEHDALKKAVQGLNARYETAIGPPDPGQSCTVAPQEDRATASNCVASSRSPLWPVGVLSRCTLYPVS